MFGVVRPIYRIFRPVVFIVHFSVEKCPCLFLVVKFSFSNLKKWKKKYCSDFLIDYVFFSSLLFLESNRRLIKSEDFYLNRWVQIKILEIFFFQNSFKYQEGKIQKKIIIERKKRKEVVIFELYRKVHQNVNYLFKFINFFLSSFFNL